MNHPVSPSRHFIGHYTDAAGVTHARANRHARIVSLVPSITELLFRLGLAAQVVGRTGFCIHPREGVRRIVKVGGTKDVDLAKLEALKPTHLIVNVDENRKDAVDAARAFVPHVIVTHPLELQDNVALYALMGSVFGRDEEAAELVALFDRELAALDAAARDWPQETVLYLIWRDPWMTVGPQTYISSVLRHAGWITLPLATDLRYPALQPDDPVWRAADRILLSSEPYRFRERHVQEVAAIAECNVVQLIDGEMVSWYGPRAIAGMRYLRDLRGGSAPLENRR